MEVCDPRPLHRRSRGVREARHSAEWTALDLAVVSKLFPGMRGRCHKMGLTCIA